MGKLARLPFAERHRRGETGIRSSDFTGRSGWLCEPAPGGRGWRRTGALVAVPRPSHGYIPQTAIGLLIRDQLRVGPAMTRKQRQAAGQANGGIVRRLLKALGLARRGA
jgi:hypothetical protein